MSNHARVGITPKMSLTNSPLRFLRNLTTLLYITMASRLAACEACRKAKVACDHKQPACTRCINNDRAGICIYRTTPFKRKRVDSSTPSVQQSPKYEIYPPALCDCTDLFMQPAVTISVLAILRAKK